jgi:hypothetical protein
VISLQRDNNLSNSDHAIAAGDANEDALVTTTARVLVQHPPVPVLLGWFWDVWPGVNSSMAPFALPRARDLE